MNTLFKLSMIAIAVSMISSASADYRPGRMRPVEGGKMEVREATGIFKNVDQVNLVRAIADGSKRELLTAGIERGYYPFEVTSRTPDICGSTVIQGSIRSNGPTGYFRTITLVDHSTRFCKDYRPYRWEGRIEFGSVRRDRLEFVGNPSPIYTTQTLNSRF